MKNLLFLLAALPLMPLPVAAQETSTTGWVCGLVLDESSALVADAEVTLFPAATPQAAPAEPLAPPTAGLARSTSGPHGEFCLQDLPPGFYELRVAKEPWPAQPSRTVEVRAGLMNRLNPIELELEPGEPRVSYEESFDAMSFGQARSLLTRLMAQGDQASLREAARRLLPKRGVRIEVGRLALGHDPKPLCEELIRQVESGYLPPLKTARYLHAIADLFDPRTEANAMRLFLQKLRDGRRVPVLPTTAGVSDTTLYVSDIAIQGVARVAGKDFKWKYGTPPMQNQQAITAALTWWAQELERRREREQR